MELNLQFLSQCFIHSLSPAPDTRRAAEAQLGEAAAHPNFALVVLQLVAEPSIDEQIRQAAAVCFKNHIRSRWTPPSDSSISPIEDAEKAQIKSIIVPFMLSSPPSVQSQLIQSLSIISNYESLRSQPLLTQLVPELCDPQKHGDCVRINAVLAAASLVFERFVSQSRTNDLLFDLKYCLDIFAAPLLDVFVRTAEYIDSMSSSNTCELELLKRLFETQRLCCRIFYLLNFIDLPEFFEDNMGKWMNLFKKYLTTHYQKMEESADGLAIVNETRAAIIESINVYMEKYEEEFKEHTADFMSAIWKLLGSMPQSDILAVMAIKFLTTVSTSVHHALFATDGVIEVILQSIVIPNVRLREEDEELFEMNYVEFIRRDMEGSDSDTRRRIACELVKGIAKHYREKQTVILSVQIQNLLSSHAANPAANWKDKECVIYLVVSLAARKGGGDACVSSDLIDVSSFTESIIVPELKNGDVNSIPMMKTSALKFFIAFRYCIPKPLAMQMFADVVKFLAAESNVVHSYAAICIEKLLSVKGEKLQLLYTSADITPFLHLLLNNLFNALKFADSGENQYVMKCIVRTLGVAEVPPEIAAPCIAGLTAILNEVCKNPKNPIFNHFLFESVAVLVRRACERDTSLVQAFERSLFPSLEMILANGITEFMPYAFQILALLVDLNRPPLSASYMQIFHLLLSPELWNRQSNVPALVRLLQAFLHQVPHDEKSLRQVLGIFRGLLSSPKTEEQSFYILNSMVESLSYPALSPYMEETWKTIFSHLQSKRTPRLEKSLLVFMSLFLIKHGSENLVNTMNSVQPNIFWAVLHQFWIPNLKLVTGPMEVKLSAVASIKLACESPAVLNDAGTWGQMVNNTITLLSRPEQDRIVLGPDVPDMAEFKGYTASFVKLSNAWKEEDDPLKEINDPKEFFVSSLSKLSALYPGRYLKIINDHVEQANHTALLQLCSNYKYPIV